VPHRCRGSAFVHASKLRRERAAGGSDCRPRKARGYDDRVRVADRARRCREALSDGKLDYHALRGVDLTIGAGEFVAIVGPFGSGKTTILNIVTGIDRPSAGTVMVDGRRIDTMSEEVVNVEIPLAFPVANVIHALVGTVVLALVITWLPIRRAVRFRPGEALRYA